MRKRKNNNGIFYVVISLVAVLGIGSVLFAYSVSQSVNVAGDYNYYESEVQTVPEEVNFGASAGPDIYWDTNIFGSFTYGGGDYNATTTAAVTYTLIGKDLSFSYIDILNNKESLTLTLPATSTMLQFLPEVGSTRTWLIHNATSTASRTITVSAGAGMDLVTASSTANVIDTGGWAKLNCTQIYYRATDNENVMCSMGVAWDAD